MMSHQHFAKNRPPFSFPITTSPSRETADPSKESTTSDDPSEESAKPDDSLSSNAYSRRSQRLAQKGCYTLSLNSTIVDARLTIVARLAALAPCRNHFHLCQRKKGQHLQIAAPYQDSTTKLRVPNLRKDIVLPLGKFNRRSSPKWLQIKIQSMQ